MSPLRNYAMEICIILSAEFVVRSRFNQHMVRWWRWIMRTYNFCHFKIRFGQTQLISLDYVYCFLNSQKVCLECLNNIELLQMYFVSSYVVFQAIWKLFAARIVYTRSKVRKKMLKTTANPRAIWEWVDSKCCKGLTSNVTAIQSFIHTGSFLLSWSPLFEFSIFHVFSIEEV